MGTQDCTSVLACYAPPPTTAPRAGGPSAILLALDQHRRLLTGRGRLGDIVRLRLQAGRLLIGVVESKLTRKAVTSPHDAIVEARDQVRTTLNRLQHFTASRPLALRARASLGRIILDQLHLSELSPAQAEGVLVYWNAILQPATLIEVEPESVGCRMFGVSRRRLGKPCCQTAECVSRSTIDRIHYGVTGNY